MKKIAFILAITLIFLVGITTVLKHKISAQTTTQKTTTQKTTEQKPNIVLWIPIDNQGDVVFDRVSDNPTQSRPPYQSEYPTPGNYEKIEFTKTITVTKVKKNPYCYWVQQGGNLVERCF